MYEERYIAFIDILGFKNIVTNTFNFPEEFNRLDQTLSYLESLKRKNYYVRSNNMKKFLSVFLTAALAVSMLAGCGSKNETVTAKVIDIDLTNEEYAFGVDKNQPELLEKTNEFIAKIKSDGTLDEICKKYFSDGEPEAVKSATLDTSKDQLVVATNAAFEPFEYTKGEDYYGIDMEIAKLLADELGKELVIENMDFDAVCLSVSQQKCDIAMAGLTINEEREEYVTFTDSYYSASQRLIVPSNVTTFDDCKTADDVAAKLAETKSSDQIGVQQGTTGQYYVEGSEDWDFPGLPAKCVT